MESILIKKIVSIFSEKLKLYLTRNEEGGGGSKEAIEIQKSAYS